MGLHAGGEEVCVGGVDERAGGRGGRFGVGLLVLYLDGRSSSRGLNVDWVALSLAGGGGGGVLVSEVSLLVGISDFGAEICGIAC